MGIKQKTPNLRLPEAFAGRRFGLSFLLVYLNPVPKDKAEIRGFLLQSQDKMIHLHNQNM